MQNHHQSNISNGVSGTQSSTHTGSAAGPTGILKQPKTLEVDQLPIGALRRYSRINNVKMSTEAYDDDSTTSLYGYGNREPKKFSSSRLAANAARAQVDSRPSRDDLIIAVERHYQSLGMVKEQDVITSFLYAVKNKDKVLKLPFI